MTAKSTTPTRSGPPAGNGRGRKGRPGSAALDFWLVSSREEISVALLSGSSRFLVIVSDAPRRSSTSREQQYEVSATTKGIWKADGNGPENFQVNKDEIVLLTGHIQTPEEFNWQIFLQGQTVPKPKGKSSAILFKGGSAEDRLTKAKEQVRLRAEGEGKVDWEKLELR